MLIIGRLRLCFHKELMKRTRETHDAFEARDYVVSLLRRPGHAVTAQALTRDSTKTGDLGALWLRREKPPCTHPATGFLIPESRMEKGAKLFQEQAS